MKFFGAPYPTDGPAASSLWIPDDFAECDGYLLLSFLGVDVPLAVELGAAIMLNKPIIAVAFPGVPVPEKLRLIADHVIEGDIDTEEGQKEVAIALSKVIGDPQ